MQRDLYGFGGWLILFVIGFSVLTPLIELVVTYVTFYGAGSDAFKAQVTNWTGLTVTIWILVAVECALFGYVGYRLIKDYRPSTIRLTRVAILISGLILPSFGVLLFGLFLEYPLVDIYAAAFNERPLDFIQPVIWAGIWFLYFAKSERVRITYLSETDDSELGEVFR